MRNDCEATITTDYSFPHGIKFTLYTKSKHSKCGNVSGKAAKNAIELFVASHAQCNKDMVAVCIMSHAFVSDNKDMIVFTDNEEIELNELLQEEL